jgi:hypothetical protein
VDSQNNSNSQGGGSGQGGSSGGNSRRRRYRGGGGGQNRAPQDPNQGGGPNQGPQQPREPNRNQPADNRNADNRNRPPQQSGGGQSRHRRGSGGRVLTTNQVLVKYDNLLEQHLITRRKYYEYFNRVDERQLYKLEKNFFDSIEHLRRFEFGLEPWQREALEKRKTERYRLDLTYSGNRGWNPEEVAKADYSPDENEDPHFKESQREAFDEYREDTEESVGSYEDYLKLKGQA